MIGQKDEYDRLFEAIPHKGKLALHVCCAPCACGVLPRLDGFEILPYYYNPNIDTREEYALRAAQFPALGISPVVAPYDHDLFLRLTRGRERDPEGGERCRICIAHRLEETAKFAAAHRADWFCSTLSVSPHKDARFINETGERLAAVYGVAFLPNDFKKQDGFLLSTRRSKALGLYRQSYCGCTRTEI